MTQAYSIPVAFNGFLTWDVSEAQARSFGMALGEYSAVLTTMKDQIDIAETDIIFWKNIPEENVPANPEQADYRVVGVIPSLNFTRYVLKKNE